MLPAISLLQCGYIRGSYLLDCIKRSRELLFRIYRIYLFPWHKPDRTLCLHILASTSQTNGADCGVRCLRPPLQSNLCTTIQGRQKRLRHSSHARALAAVLGSKPFPKCDRHTIVIAAGRLWLTSPKTGLTDIDAYWSTENCFTDNAVVWYFYSASLASW